jgi:hypothetical protein
VALTLAEQARVCDWHAHRDAAHAQLWAGLAEQCRLAWEAKRTEPRSALPQRIATIVESDFPKLSTSDKRKWCEQWENEYRTRPKGSDDDADEDVNRADDMALLVAVYRGLEVCQEWWHPDEWLRLFAVDVREGRQP